MTKSIPQESWAPAALENARSDVRAFRLEDRFPVERGGRHKNLRLEVVRLYRQGQGRGYRQGFLDALQECRAARNGRRPVRLPWLQQRRPASK